MIVAKNQNLVLLFLGSFLAQIIQVGTFSLFLSQKLDGLDVSLSLIGWFVGIQWVVVLLLAPFAPFLGAKLGLERLNILSSLVMITGLFAALSEEVWLLAISSVLLGAALIVRWVACDALIVRFVSTQKLGQSIGIHEALMGFGIAAGPLFFIFLTLDQVVYAMICLAVFSTLCFQLVRPQNDHIGREENIAMQKEDLFLLKIALIMALVGGFIETAAVAFLPFYFEDDGFSLQSSAWFVSAFGLGGTLLQLPLGLLADRVGYRLAQLMACLVALLGLLGLYFSGSSFLAIFGTLFILGGAIGAFNTLAVIQAGSEISPKKTASSMAYIAAAYTFGGIVGPVVTSNVLHVFPADAILVTYSIIIITVAVTMLSGRRDRIA
ncbi:MAG: MFS transporter [Pseudomonadota bacterium]